MKKIIFIEYPNKLSVKELINIKGGVDACTDYSGCLSFDTCTSGFTGSCSAIYTVISRPKKLEK